MHIQHCDAYSTCLLYLKGLTPQLFWDLWISIAFQVIGKGGKYRLYAPNPEFHDAAPPMVWHNLMKTAQNYDKHGWSPATFVLVCVGILLFFSPE
jgi:hypothetical protein